MIWLERLQLVLPLLSILTVRLHLDVDATRTGLGDLFSSALLGNGLLGRGDEGGGVSSSLGAIRLIYEHAENIDNC